MPEQPSNPNESTLVVTKMRREIRYDAVAAVIAALVGMLALVVAGYTAYIQRQQVRAQVWPYLQMGKSDAGGHYEIAALNKGVGPVIVKSVQVLADGKPVQDWHTLFRLMDFKPVGKYVFSTLNQTVLAQGDRTHWIAFDNAADVDAFVADWAHFHVEARVCYSSTLGESWLTVYRPNWSGGYRRPRPVSRCPAVPDAQQFDD